MRFSGETVAAVFGLLILGALVGGILYMLSRFWGECAADTEFAMERFAWPTTTVQATLLDTSLKQYGKNLAVIGHYEYEFGGSEHTAEVYEISFRLQAESETAARELKEAGKTIQLEVQYDPDNPAVVSNEIVTYIPKCRYWIGGFFIFFCMMELLILRGLSKLIRG